MGPPDGSGWYGLAVRPGLAMMGAAVFKQNRRETRVVNKKNQTDRQTKMFWSLVEQIGRYA